MLRKTVRAQAFSRIDLCVLVGTIFFLGLYVFPALSRTSARSERAICVNNLRVIGGAFLRWSSENGERNPAQLFRVDTGSTKSLPVSTWFHFYFLSNHLGSPKFLADPSDQRMAGQPALRVATTWLNAPSGFLHPAHRNSALSYSVGVYATPAEPNSILSSDRNVQSSGPISDALFQSLQRIEPATAAWKHSVHLDAGNLLFNDGRVEQTDTTALKAAVGWNNNWNRGFQFPFVE